MKKDMLFLIGSRQLFERKLLSHTNTVRDPYVSHLINEARTLLTRIEQLATQQLQSLLSYNLSTSSQFLSSSGVPSPASSTPRSLINQSTEDESPQIEVGSMIWDPINKIWRGNDAEGRLFELRLNDLMESEDDELTVTDNPKPPRRGRIFTPVPPRYPGKEIFTHFLSSY
jgi:hypothetical protein